jgi:lipoprotein-anchoring transpeptidase ErfK/SrfK
LKAPNPNTVYGTYAYGLSGFSNRLTSFAGGDAVIGVHGTNNPASIGHTVSSGCIRMLNSDIEKLVPVLPLGTPVEIRR